MRRYQDMFRPPNEVWAVSGWLFGIAALALLRPPFWVVLTLGLCGPMAWLRCSSLFALWRFRFSLSVALVPKISIVELIVTSRYLRRERESLYLGRGFKWSRRHAEIAERINNMDADEVGYIPTWASRLMHRAMRGLETGQEDSSLKGLVRRTAMKAIREALPKDLAPVNDSAVGLPWIHGVGAGEDNMLLLPLASLTAHTLITGTTRAGKTRLYELLTAQLIDTNAALIVIDPKNDKDWERRLRRECARTRRKLLIFDLARPDISIRLNPLANWNTLSEPATRIGQLVDADGTFAAFAWKTLYRVQRGLVAAGIKPSIRNTKQYVQLGVEPLAEQVLAIFFSKRYGADWDRDIKTAPNAGPKALSRLELMIHKYIKAGHTDDTIDGLISMVRHSKEHYSKMVQVLEPILEMLGSDEIGAMLSPDPADTTDTREIWDLKRALDERAVLLIKTNSLPNKTIAAAVGSIILADLASTLGAIYNFGEKTDAYLFVDEAAEVANDQLTQILNKGGGAGLKAFIAMQSIADLTVRFQDRDKCEQFLANLNNTLSLRVQSQETAEYISMKFAEIDARKSAISYSSGSESSSAFTEFRSNTSRSLDSQRLPLVTPHLLMHLPPLHYFAILSGQAPVKGALPFIEG